MLVCHKIFILTSAKITKTPAYQTPPTVRPNQGLTGLSLASATRTGFVFILKEWSFSYGYVIVSGAMFRIQSLPLIQLPGHRQPKDLQQEMCLFPCRPSSYPI